MRRRGPGLVRTAAVVGTASAVSGRVANRQQQRFAGRDAQQQPPPAGPPPGAAAAPSGDVGGQLAQIASLHESGVLSDDEFEAAKAKVLGT